MDERLDERLDVMPFSRIFENAKITPIFTNSFGSYLKFFKCSRSKEEENFLHNKSIEFELTNKARTYLVVSGARIVGYFSLAMKPINLSNLNKSKRKALTAGEANTENTVPI